MFLAGAIVILGSNLLALVALYLMRRAAAAERWRATNDVLGYYSAVVGSLYGVLVAFMLYAVWNGFERAHDEVAKEAHSLIDLYWLADGLPAPYGDRMRAFCLDYGNFVADEEWTDMEKGQMNPQGAVLVNEMWREVVRVQPRSTSEQVIYDHFVTQLIALMEERRFRHLEVHQHLAPILWVVLVTGGVITIALCCMFGVNHFRMHIIKTVALTTLIALMLYTISELAQPYQGVVRLSAADFHYTIQSMKAISVPPP